MLQRSYRSQNRPSWQGLNANYVTEPDLYKLVFIIYLSNFFDPKSKLQKWNPLCFDERSRWVPILEKDILSSMKCPNSSLSTQAWVWTFHVAKPRFESCRRPRTLALYRGACRIFWKNDKDFLQRRFSISVGCIIATLAIFPITRMFELCFKKGIRSIGCLSRSGTFFEVILARWDIILPF